MCTNRCISHQLTIIENRAINELQTINNGCPALVRLYYALPVQCFVCPTLVSMSACCWAKITFKLSNTSETVWIPSTTADASSLLSLDKAVLVIIIIDREASEIMYLVASVSPSVRLSVRQSALSRLNRLTYDLDLGARLCRVQQRAKRSHYQSEVFVCVSHNRVYAVDRLLIVIINASGGRCTLNIGQKSTTIILY